jgi:polar amino acid transport system permease protein
MLSFLQLLGLGEQGWSHQFLAGALATLEISFGAFAIGLMIGGGVAAVKLRGRRLPLGLANAYSTICRAVPEVLLIIILFYAGQSALNDLIASFGYDDEDIGISGFAAAIIVLGLVQGAYASEIIRGAVLAIPRGQIEAAQAFGLSGFTLFRRIILPSVIPYAIGGLANLWMAILKDSALISVVGYNELLSTAKQAAGSTKLYFSFFLFTAAIYYCITLVSNAAVHLLERRIRRWMPRLA